MDEAFLTDFRIYEPLANFQDYYTITGKSRMLTRKEAEDLLKKGYVFTGHSCPICAFGEQEVDFTDYDAVTLDYTYGNNGMCILFYYYYKLIHENESGFQTYAVTKVSAIEIEGLAEYFMNRAKWHT